MRRLYGYYGKKKSGVKKNRQKRRRNVEKKIMQDNIWRMEGVMCGTYTLRFVQRYCNITKKTFENTPGTMDDTIKGYRMKTNWRKTKVLLNVRKHDFVQTRPLKIILITRIVKSRVMEKAG